MAYCLAEKPELLVQVKTDVEKRVSQVLEKANAMEAQLEQAREERRQVEILTSPLISLFGQYHIPHPWC